MNFPKPIFLTSKTVLHQENQRLQLNQEKLVADSAATIQALNEHVRELQATVQATTDPLTNTSSTSNEHYTGNPYKTYATKIKALTEKYNGESDWGCMTTRNIIDVRAAFVIGNGAKAIKQDGLGEYTADRELTFIREFIRLNNLDKESPNDWAVGAELEGKALIRLVVDKEKKNIRTVYVSWSKYPYTVTADNPDLYHYTKAFYTGTDTLDSAAGAPGLSNQTRDVSFNLNENEFVYVRFGGSSEKINEPIPKTALVLRQVEDLDKELWDWRKINSLFAAPTPTFMVETTDEADRLQDWIKTTNWRIGKAIVIANGKFDLVCYSGEGFTTIKNALEADVTTISGSTGVPVHFLGHPELLSNRATAISLLELIEMATNKERSVWEGGYEELFQKAMILYNDAFHAGFNPDAVTAKIPFISSAKLEFIQKVYLPMYEANTISLETFLSYLTDIDVDEEMKRIEADKKKDDERNAANNSGADAGALPGRPERNRQPGSAGGNKAVRS